MHGFQARRALMVSALFVVSGCSGGPSTPGTLGANSNAVQQSERASTSIVKNASFVHTGVPFLPANLQRAAKKFWLQPSYETKKPLVFEADQEESAVNVYAAGLLASDPAPLATIPMPVGCPYGEAMDKSGSLYVATNCSGNTVEVFAKGKTTPKYAITDGISNPLGLAIDESGVLYVSNYPASITEYKPGAKTPFKTITGQGLQDPFGLTLDKKGNLYVADFIAAQVFEIAAGTTTVTPLGLTDLEEPLGVAVDKKDGDLWVTDGEGDKVNVYPLGSTTPSHTITAGYNDPYAISIYTTGSVAISNIGKPEAFYAYEPNKYASYATVTSGVELPTGLLWAKP
jgi:DNA-binding beta-propeller fold protein YncE